MKKIKSFVALIIFNLTLACTIVPTQQTIIDQKIAQTVKQKEDTKKVHFAYEGEDGPAHWGDLTSEWKLCKEGKAQAPIDIDTSKVLKENLSPLKFSYHENILKIINNGHTVQVNFPEGNILNTHNKKYTLLQYHIHAPSEHKINGKASDLELHLVHKADDGELLVVAILINKGSKNEALDSFFSNLPDKEGPEISKDMVKINPINILPKDAKYYNYSGSLTTPSCSEGVNWHLLKKTIEASKGQIENFTSLYNLNARPVQALNTRVVKISV